MGRVANEVLDLAVFFYKTLEDAKKGTGFGGCGGVVSIRSEVDGSLYLYAITNDHVVFPDKKFKFSVVRAKTRLGNDTFFETVEEDWVLHPDCDDLVAVRLKGLPSHEDLHSVDSKPLDHKKIISAFGPGDEVFAVGRFIYRDSMGALQQHNDPIVRYGHISSRPDKLVNVWQKARHQDQQAFLVDLTAHSGFSGAFVYCSIPLLSARPVSDPVDLEIRGYRVMDATLNQETKKMEIDIVTKDRLDPILVGIYTGHYSFARSETEWNEPEPTVGHSGIGYVIPAYKIVKLLEYGQLKAERDSEENKKAAVT